MEELQNFCDRVGKIVKERDWKKDWASGGCYIHLEVSEFVESLRGKGSALPPSEAADILIALFAVLDWYGIKVSDVLHYLELNITNLEHKKIGRMGSD